MGPLAGVTVVEVGALGPAPFCGMLFADMGADVILVERKGGPPSALDRHLGDRKYAIVHRGKRSLAIDLKKPGAAAVLLRVIGGAGVLIEGFRPGVMEKLGLGPEECLRANARLVYGRVTGWGQYGPLAHAPGHDINYIALAGALYHGGRSSTPPACPPTLVGDVGGGAMFLAVGILAALLAAQQSGKGQVVDAAISDGAALMTSLLYGLRQQGAWIDVRQGNLLDGGSHWYDSYRCADGECIAIGALEPKFYRVLLEKCGLDNDPAFTAQFDRDQWPSQKEKMSNLFRTRTRDEWCELLEGSDACFAPVLSLGEAAGHPHQRARRTYVDIDGVTQPAPAPRLSGTPAAIRGGPPGSGEHTDVILREAGLAEPEIAALRVRDVI